MVIYWLFVIITNYLEYNYSLLTKLFKTSNSGNSTRVSVCQCGLYMINHTTD